MSPQSGRFAMQKVVGSNPISRFFAIALHVGGSASTGEVRINWNHPRSPTFQALLRISAWNGLDVRRSAAIPPCIDPAVAVTGGRRGAFSPMAQERITVDPNRMRGLPCIRDTRATVSAVFGQLAVGASIDDLLVDYPYLEREDVLAALEYAAAAQGEGAGSSSAGSVKLLDPR